MGKWFKLASFWMCCEGRVVSLSGNLEARGLQYSEVCRVVHRTGSSVFRVASRMAMPRRVILAVHRTVWLVNKND
jgi:hypothetical protein